MGQVSYRIDQKTEEKIDQIFTFCGLSGDKTKKWLGLIDILYEKLILDKNSPAAQLPTGEQKPENNSMSERNPSENPTPLEAKLRSLQTENIILQKELPISPRASTHTLKNSENGSKSGVSLSDRLEYQRRKAEIWQNAKINAAKGIETVKEQVRRFRNTESNRRAPVDFEPEGKRDNGRPVFGYIDDKD